MSNQFGASTAGQGKGGALYGYFLSVGGLTFSGNTAPNTGAPNQCATQNGVDSVDFCGALDAGPNSVPSLSAAGGDGQTTLLNTAFSVNLSARFTINGGALPGLPITFTTPAAAAGRPGGTFLGGAVTYTGLTDANGAVTAPVFTANGTLGTYTVTASIGTVSASFTLTTATTAASVLTAVSPINLTLGTGQQGGPFAVLAKDAQGQPQAGVQVVFFAPSQAVSGKFPAGVRVTVITDVNGIATSPVFKANYALGTYTVGATSGSALVQFNLTNVIPAGSPLTKVGDTLASYGFALKALLLAPDGTGIAGALIHFSAPSGGPTGTFVDTGVFTGQQNSDALTGPDGVAMVGLASNETPGSYMSQRLSEASPRRSIESTSTT